MFAQRLATREAGLKKADYVEGLAKGLAVLECFDPERQRLNATLTAQRAGLTRAAARRQLLTLAHLGYLESDGSHYWLSPKVLRLAGSYLSSARLPRLLQPALDRLALASRQACSAVVLDGHEVVIIARSLGASAARWRESPRGPVAVMAYGLHQGARLPVHATSTGRMLLASLDAPALAAWFRSAPPLARLTAHTQTEPKVLRKLIAQARRDDHCVASEEHELGVHAVAVPLRDRAGRTLAAINVVTSPTQLQPELLQRELLPLMREAVREVQPLV